MIVDDLREVRKLIEAGFCQGTYAQARALKNNDRWFFRSEANAVDACKFCLVGAVFRIGKEGTNRTQDMLDTLGSLVHDGDEDDLVEFSDNHTQTEVLALITRAIEANP